MHSRISPPRLAEWLLRALIPDPRLEQAVLGDLAEEWADRVRRDGERAANRWYRREAMKTAPHLLADRLPKPSTIYNSGVEAMRNGMSWLDLKLGARMLVKYPGLTVVGTVAIAIAVAIGGGWFEFYHDYFHATLPLPQGERIVGIQNWNVATNSLDAHALHDFITWRRELRSIQEIGAFRRLDRNVITPDGRSEPVAGAAISASAFKLVRVPPLLGRPLVEADDAPGAEPVAVIGYGLWQARFGGDPKVVGRTIQIGSERATILGVMPEGFAFPIQQSLWVPLGLDVSSFARGQSPLIQAFGRLAPGATLASAQAELTALGRRAAVNFPETNRHLEPRILPYVASLLGVAPWQLELVNAFFVLILLIASVNVATLVFARTATREREIAVRRALGASRSRIIAQLFAEALVLASFAATLGLLVVWWGQGWGMNIFWGVQGGTSVRPFWWNSNLSLATVVYVGGLAVFGATVVGVLPALKATRSGVQARLQASTDGSGMRFGIVWTGVIVVQVALSVLLLPDAAAAGREALRYEAGGLGFPADEYLSVRLQREVTATATDSTTAAADEVRLRNAYSTLEERLRAEPGVLGVTVATKLPGTDSGEHPAVEVEGVGSDGSSLGANVSAIDPGFFHAFDARIVTGRDFNLTDITAKRGAAIVNESFVRERLHGRNAIGQRIRYVHQRGRKSGPWMEIVGVAPDLAMNAFNPGQAAGFYQPLLSHASVQLAVHLRGDPKAFTTRLRTIAAEIDPSLRLYQPQTLGESARALKLGNSFFASVMAGITAIALLLSAAGIYALMSFTVAQRTREIGVRAALGADSRRIIATIMSRAFMQIGLGAAVGTLIAAFTSESVSKDGPALLFVAAGLMMTVGLLACFAPMRRALRIPPTEALRASD